MEGVRRRVNRDGGWRVHRPTTQRDISCPDRAPRADAERPAIRIPVASRRDHVKIKGGIMPYPHTTFAVVASALAALLVGPRVACAQTLEPDAEGFLIARPDDLRPPEGSTRINIIGNPSEPGLYVLQITWAPGTGSRPHFHDQARYIQVLKGTWWVSTGSAADVYDPESMTPVEAGTFIYEPPNGHHYDMAKDEEVVVQIWGMGPVTTTSIPQPDSNPVRR
jgi:quercetin dioxygenase-like cupin family protein